MRLVKHTYEKLHDFSIFELEEGKQLIWICFLDV